MIRQPAALKYIVIRDEHTGLEFPVFAPAPVTHADMAAAWRRDPEQRRVVGAGFCQLTSTHAVTYGHSTSLQLGPRAEDARLIAAFATVTAKLNPCDHAGSLNACAFPQ